MLERWKDEEKIMVTTKRKTTKRAGETRVAEAANLKGANLPDAQREMRLSIRTSAEQKELLKRAALSRGTDLSGFVLQASLEQARQALADEAAIVLSASDYSKLCQALDEPAQPTEALKVLMRVKPVWNE